MVLFILFPTTEVVAQQFTVTPGVEYKKGPTKWNNRAQSIHAVTVDVARPEISVEALIPNPITVRNPLTTILKNESSNGNHAVAGINGSFFHMNSGAPAYLLAANNIVNTYGVISTGNDEYMSVPSAFGIDKEGKGRIGTFGYEATVTTSSGAKKIHSVNKARGTGETVLYTPTYSYSSTRSNTYGMEFVLTNLSSSIEEDYQLGKQITAKVEKILPYGGRDSVIPRNGAVLSIQGGAQAAEYADVKVGSELTLSIDLTNPWKEADFVLASGPLLVQNGKVDMTINPNSSRANSRHPRTAVAVNADGSKVFLVTVDGRQTNGVGMTLSEFGSYLVSMGAHAALNLDGGGSTTMAVRERGQEFAKLFNMPSDKAQRSISTALAAISYTEVGQARTIATKLSGPSILEQGGTTSIQVESALDVNFHVVPVNAGQMKYSVTGDIGTISSTGVFTATKTGKGTIAVTYGDATKSYPIEVLGAPTGGQLIHSFESSADWQAESARAKTTLRFDGNKAPVKDGKTALTLTYDFTGHPTGTSASYAKVTKPIVLTTKPKALGVWVFGDGENHWLRGTMTDQSGKSFTIDFTKESGLEWKGWKYVKAPISASVSGPVALTQIYIAETSSNKKNKGSIYLDRLIAEYDESHQERLFNDVANNYWAVNEIQGAVDAGWINGYTDGTFKPEQNLSRAHAAVLLSRALQLNLNEKDHPFTDVPSNYTYAKEIAAVHKAGIMTGKGDGKTFDPNGTLTRAQMAKMLGVAYKLSMGSEPVPPLQDVKPDFWAYEDIQKLQANQITIVSDGKYRPDDRVTRAQFATFITRAQK